MNALPRQGKSKKTVEFKVTLSNVLPRQGESKKTMEFQHVKLKVLMLIWNKSAFPKSQ